MNIEKAIKNFELRGYSVRHFATGAEAADYLAGQVQDTTVGIGGCKTADQLGLYERLSEHNQVFWHWREPGMETLQKANAAAVYITLGGSGLRQQKAVCGGRHQQAVPRLCFRPGTGAERGRRAELQAL